MIDADVSWMFISGVFSFSVPRLCGMAVGRYGGLLVGDSRCERVKLAPLIHSGRIRCSALADLADIFRGHSEELEHAWRIECPIASKTSGGISRWPLGW